MHHTILTWVAGGALFAAAAVTATAAVRRLVRSPAPGRATPTLLWLLATAALAVVGAALWAERGTSMTSTWPFAVAFVIAVGPLVVAAVRRRGRSLQPDDTSRGH